MNWPNNAPTFQLKTTKKINKRKNNKKKKLKKGYYKTRKSRSGNVHTSLIPLKAGQRSVPKASRTLQQDLVSCTTWHNCNCLTHVQPRSRVRSPIVANSLCSRESVCDMFQWDIRVTLNTVAFIELLRSRASECAQNNAILYVLLLLSIKTAFRVGGALCCCNFSVILLLLIVWNWFLNVLCSSEAQVNCVALNAILYRRL